jgi:hypothetical protein
MPPAEPINLDIGTPPVVVVKHSLAQRASRLVRFYDAGIIGLGYDGMVKMRDGSRLNLAQRQIAEKLIDNENPDRNSLIFAIAEAQGGQAWEPAARAAQVRRWQEQFHCRLVDRGCAGQVEHQTLSVCACRRPRQLRQLVAERSASARL